MHCKGRGAWLEFVSSKSKTFVAFCFCFLVGVATASVLEERSRSLFFPTLFGVVLSFTFLFRTHKEIRFIFIAILCFVVGLLRYAYAFPDPQTDISSLNDQRVELFGVITEEPDVRLDGVRYVIQARAASSSATGRVHLSSGLYPRYGYGDQLQLLCDLKRPEPIEDFRFDMYMARIGVFSLCTRPKIERSGEAKGSFLFEMMLQAKGALADKISILWHEPYASLVAGLLYGYRGGLGSLNEDFNRTGVTHIVAISGYNISMVVTIVRSLLVRVYIPRKRAFYLIIVGVTLFVLFTGASASVVRAGVMGILVLTAQQVGRISRAFNVIILTITLMVFHNPLILFWDAGFQLSCASTLGIVYLSPILKTKCGWIPETLGLQESSVSTLSAIAATFPLIVFQFERFSLVAPLVNVLILWTIPWIMLASALAVLLSFVLKVLSWVPYTIASLGMIYIVSVVRFFSRLSFASIDIRMPLFFALMIYVALITRVYIFYHKSTYDKKI